MLAVDQTRSAGIWLCGLDGRDLRQLSTDGAAAALAALIRGPPGGDLVPGRLHILALGPGLTRALGRLIHSPAA